ncbi:DUF6541 family protein [Amycolatopsis suaedae]|uniref:Copper-transporting ATPase n=1 Tax=Amycolatopsis suaedae TaxID=2510978 RepID=A0A4Q7J4T5_9PSEU|nr:DUF6541 family protein [Amycolatopsis suaedae]RZQ62047.1 copper-transporting ATPase [Amycolatopsis suaedae]
MPTPDTFWTYATTIGIYLVVLVVPGLLVGLAAGLRGWSLAGLTPLFTYAVTGLAGPWLAEFGLPYNVGTVAAVTLLFAGLGFTARKLTARLGWGKEAAGPPVAWTARAHWAVAACVALATVLSVVVVLSAAGGPNAVFQRWDTVYHANGLRYIADTGDGSLTGMSTINWYPDGSYYPNAYHLVGALVYSLSGATVPAALNAVTVPVAGIFALSLVAVIHRFGGRAVFAGCTALVAAAATTGAYESVSSGLLPFALGIVLTPLSAVALQVFLDRPGLDTGFVLALSAAGLLAAHSSTLFGAILLALPLLVQRWWQRKGKPWRDLALVAPAALAAGLMTAPHILGALTFSSGAYPYNPWASDIPVMAALTQLATFRQVLDEPQIWLSLLLAVGVIMLWKLGRMLWVVMSAVLLSAMFVLVASYGAEPWVISMSRPWWNDRYRLMALAAIPLCLLAGHGLAELQRLSAKAIGQWSWLQARPNATGRVGLATGAVVLALLAVLTNGFYTSVNAQAVAYAYHNGPESEHREQPVSADEVRAMLELQKFAVPGERVMNERSDGTAWVYAIAGVKPVAGHYDPSVPPPDAKLLARHFREYDTNPEVRAAVERLNVRHVLIGHGSIQAQYSVTSGLRDLEGLRFLRKEYSNPGAVIYTVLR